MAKSYYTILGVEPEATPEQIKSAYRQQVKQLHPDHYGEDCAPFLAVQEAYDVLSNPARRRAYDENLARQRQRTEARRRPVSPGPVEPLIPPESPLDLDLPWVDDIFESFGENFDYRPDRAQEIEVEVRLTPLEARRGGQFRLSLPLPTRCPTCRGYGVIGPFTCAHCYGEGAIIERRSLLVSVPPGVRHNEILTTRLDRVGLPQFYLTLNFVIMGF